MAWLLAVLLVLSVSVGNANVLEGRYTAHLRQLPFCEREIVVQGGPEKTARDKLLFDGFVNVCDGGTIRLDVERNLNSLGCNGVRVRAVLRTRERKMVGKMIPKSDTYLYIMSRTSVCVYGKIRQSNTAEEVVIKDPSPGTQSTNDNSKTTVGMVSKPRPSFWAWLGPVIGIVAVGIIAVCVVGYWCSKRVRNRQDDGPSGEYGGRRMSQTWIPAMSDRLSQSFVGLRLNAAARTGGGAPPSPRVPKAPQSSPAPPERKESPTTTPSDAIVEVGTDEIQPMKEVEVK